ncbi:MAG: hypothetical protein ACKVUT_13490 [Gaiella sp.]
MSRILRRRPSPAMVVACIALLVALSGTGIAAVVAVAPNSVGTVHLQASAVTGPKIATDAVTSAKIRNGSLLRSDFKAGQLPRGPQGPAGPAGATGTAGPAGATGAAGTIGAITVRTATVAVDGGGAQNSQYVTRSVTKNCENGEKAISAGTGWSDDDNDLELFTSEIEPVISNNVVTGFRARGGNDSGNGSTLTLYVLCYKG